LEKADPSVYKLMTWQEGFSTQDFNFEYRIGKSKWGLWLSRKPISVYALKAVATTLRSNEKESSQRTEQPTATINGTTKDQIQDRINQSHQENVQARNSNTRLKS